MRPITRITPNLPASAYKTYAITSPISTHFRPATCEEAGCGAYAGGWHTTVDESTELGQRQAYYVRKLSGRRFSEHRNEAGLTVFDFEAGQQCFRSAEHRVSLQRPENFTVLGGDWRGNPLGIQPYKHDRAENWVDDFANHQQKLADRHNQG